MPRAPRLVRHLPNAHGLYTYTTGQFDAAINAVAVGLTSTELAPAVPRTPAKLEVKGLSLVNRQAPFSFTQKTRKARILPVEFSRNISGACAKCGKGYQKIPKPMKVISYTLSKPIFAPLCKVDVCRGKILEFPKELRPWKFLSAAAPNYGDFECVGGCGQIFNVYHIFASLCGVDLHRYVCRLCCFKDHPTKAIPTKS